MRNYLVIPTAVVLLVGLFAVGGCVERVEYDRALAACRRANDELQNVQGELRSSRESKEQLERQFADYDQTLKAKQNEIGLLDAKNRQLRRSFDELADLYDKAQRVQLPPPPGVLLPPQVDTALQGFAKDNAQLVEYLPKYGMVKFKADFTFEKGKDDVSAGAAEALKRLVKILNSEHASKFHVYIAGHTDDIPIKKPQTLRRHPTNWYLSAHRAVEVQNVLVKSGLRPERIGVVGFGEYHPIEKNKPNKKGNPKNRRVEIWIVPPDRLLTASAGAT